MSPLSRDRKIKLARIIRISPVRWLLGLGIRLSVPKHRTGVVVVGYNNAGQILMLKHVFHPLVQWGLPGGWLERGESPEQCAQRELFEETGLSAKFGSIIHHSFEEDPPHIGLAFIARIIPGEIKLSSEIVDSEWIEPKTLPVPILPFVRNAISAANNYVELWDKLDRGKNE